MRRNKWPAPVLKEALAPLARRVYARYGLESLRLALTWGLATAAAALAVLKLTPFYLFLFLAAAPGLAVLALVFGWRVYCFPDARKVVWVADDLGLNAGAITAYRLLEQGKGDPWSRAAMEEGIGACRRLTPQKYPLVLSWRPWRNLVLLGGIFFLQCLLPAPFAAHWEARQAEKEALAAAAVKSEAVAGQIKRLPPEQRELLPEKLIAALDALPEATRKAKDRQDAARSLERLGRELKESLALYEQNRQDAQNLARVWKNSKDTVLSALANALEKGEGEETKRLAEGLKNLSGRSEAGRSEAALNLFQAAEAVYDPALRENLRELARSLLFPPGAEKTGSLTGGKESLALGQKLADLAPKAAAAASFANAAADVYNLAGTLRENKNARAIAQAGSGSGSDFSGGAGMSGGNAAGLALRAAAGSAGNGLGMGNGNVPGGGTGPDSSSSAVSTGTGLNSGAGGDRGGGTGLSPKEGGAFSGAGPGAGNSGGSDGAGVGAGGQGAGTAGGGLEKIYTPLLGGSGPELHLTGQIQPGTAGAGTDLPFSPVAPGMFRPYREVLPLYKEEALNPISSAPLPPDLQSLVWYYFRSLE